MVLFGVILEVGATFTESLIGYKFMEIFSDTEMNKKKQWLLSVCLTALVSFLNFHEIFSMSTVLFAVLFLSITCWKIFDIPLIKSFSVLAFYSMCMLLLDFFAMSLLGGFFRDPHFAEKALTVQSRYRWGCLVLAKFFLVISYVFFKRATAELPRIKLNKINLLTIFGYIVYLYFSKLTMEAIDANRVFSWLLLVLVIILSVLALVAYGYYTRESEQKRIIEMRNEIVDEKNRELLNIYNGNAQLYHDMKNHINVLSHMLETEKYKEAREYIEDLSDLSASTQSSWTGNDIFDCIINVKRAVCVQEEIQLLVDADLIQAELNSVFLNAIFSNLMDNAVEACRLNEKDQRWIRVTIRQINEMIMIKIKNPYRNKAEENDEGLVTTKDNKPMHGWGMKSVQDTVKKMGGVFTYHMGETEFTVNVTLFL